MKDNIDKVVDSKVDEIEKQKADLLECMCESLKNRNKNKCDIEKAKFYQSTVIESETDTSINLSVKLHMFIDDEMIDYMDSKIVINAGTKDGD